VLVGWGLGVLIGLTSGFVLVLLLRLALLGRPGLKTSLTVIGQFLAIPTFWFGGWMTTSALQGVRAEDYVVALATVFSGVSLYPLIKLIIVLGIQIDESERDLRRIHGSSVQK
jgi:hypothetical protein